MKKTTHTYASMYTVFFANLATKKVAPAVLMCTFAANSALALSAEQFEERIQRISSKYELLLDDQRRRASELGNEAPSETEAILDLGEMETVSFSMGIPEFSMDRWEFGFHLPEITMKMESFSFDYPKCKWDTVDFGLFKTKFLKCEKDRANWSTKVPEFKMVYHDFSMDIPKVVISNRKFSFDVPKISVGGPSDKLDKLQSEGQKVQEKIEALAGQMKTEINDVSREFFVSQRKNIEKQFAFALNTLQAAIDGSPSDKIRAQMVAKHTLVLEQRKKALQQIDQYLKNLAQILLKK